MTETDTQRRSTVAGPVTWEEMRSLLRREPMMTERTWRPTVGGLLSILAGSWNLLMGVGAIAGGSAFFTNLLPDFTGNTTLISASSGGFFIVIGLLAIIGGAFALARRGWPMVLTGSIAAVIPSPLILPFILGLFALIFNVLGHKEFWGPEELQRDIQSNVERNIEKSRS
jgi:hypothetical protein